MMSHLQQAYEYDVRIRIQNDGASPEGAALVVKDVSEGVVYEKSGVKVTAFDVDHAPVKPAFGYRIDYAGRSVVLSGDTRVSETSSARPRVDVLVHEVLVPATLQRAGVPPGRAKHIVDYHTTPEQAGEVFTRVKPKLAVYSHICMPTATEQDLVPATRKTYAGPLQLGEDLMVIEVAETVDVCLPTLRVRLLRYAALPNTAGGSNIAVPGDVAGGATAETLGGFFVTRIVDASNAEEAASRARAVVAAEWTSGKYANLGAS
jgi:ribonuclease Z